MKEEEKKGGTKEKKRQHDVRKRSRRGGVK